MMTNPSYLQNTDSFQKKHLCVFGATGSIGDSVLDLVRQHPERYDVVVLTGHSRVDKLLSLCLEFCPKIAVMVDESRAEELSQGLQKAGSATQVWMGKDALNQAASLDMVDTVVAAIVGAAGLGCTLTAIKSSKTILLANKEALVMAGKLMMDSARQHGATIIPIDSEHNAIFQCLPNQVQRDRSAIHRRDFGIVKLYLTASGGAFLHKSYDEMTCASVADAINHPNWSMGQKISVDSSTMMNKGLELIEACHLFDLNESQIEIVIHPQSIVHSMVEYVDGSILAQLGSPDMRTPIAYALAYPERISSGVQSLDLLACSKLNFMAPDLQKFACLRLARQAIRTGMGACIILNAANEVAVAGFLAGKITLTSIAFVVEMCLHHEALCHQLTQDFHSLDEIMVLDNEARQLAQKFVEAMADEI